MYRQSYTVIGDVAVSLVCSPDIVPAERDALIKLFAAEKSQWIEKNVIIQGVVKGVTAQVFLITPKEGTKHLPLKVAALRREIRAISEHFIATLPESILTKLINTPIRSMEGEVIPLRVEMPSLPHPMFNSSVTG